jgi:carnosine N-methyltransferase
MWGKWSQMQLSADETLQLAESLGFDVDHGSHTSIDTVYAHQPESLLKFTYGLFRSSFFLIHADG